MNQLALPSKLEEILKKDATLHSIVEGTVATFSDILYNSKLYFFEEYTDHGTDHIQKVLTAVEDIITPETLHLLTPKDVTVIVLAVILHDIGMHTEFSTFKALVEEGCYNDVRENLIDNKDWSELWSEYLEEAKKFNSKQRLEIFGDSNTQINSPSLHRKGSLTEDDKKLIGEFIRRYHPRLAHEISYKGIIGADGQLIEFAPTLPPMLRSLTAIVARSHGINIRDTYKYLRNVGDRAWKVPDRVNVIFLMVLIRIADYFQFGSDRVNIESLKIKTFSSPISLFEHKKHLSIEFIQPDTEDKETLFVKTKPESSVMYLKLLSLIKDIQNELDVSWAVLGEIYGNYQLDQQPKIRYRRINSNLISDQLLGNITYVPQRITFEADADLPKLLVAPLYGNDPSYGVREMTQNAVDACREREYEEKKSDSNYLPIIRIGIIKEDNNNFFIIEDNGKGMSLQELKNYFLKAGSSLRKSLDWKMRYTDDAGKSQIQRNGKFGVGVLAAFLLGEKLYVETRSIHNTEGYSFEAEIDTEQIEITKRDDLNIGTYIKILINDNIINALKDPTKVSWYAWYKLKSPHIEYVNELNPTFAVNDVSLPNDSNKLPNDFHTIRPKSIDKVVWTYNEKYRKTLLLCNGIVIPSIPNIGIDKRYDEEDKPALKHKPTISITDYDGVLPLTLNRNSIDGILSFSEELMKDIYKDLIACLLCYKIKSYVANNKIHIINDFFYHPSLSEKDAVRYSSSNLLFTENGFIFNYGFFVNTLTQERKLTIFANSSECTFSLPTLESNSYVYSLKLEDKIRLSYNEDIVDPYQGWNRSGRVTIKESDYKAVFDPTKNRIRKGLKYTHTLEQTKNGWVTYSNNYDKPIDMSLIEDIINNENIVALKEEPLSKKQSHKLFDTLIRLYLGEDMIIPYDMELRKNKFKKAFIELDEYCIQYME